MATIDLGKGSAVVAVHGLTRRFGTKIAIDNLSLDIPQGGVFGLIGGNGAGKTTLIKHILGMLRAQRGTVRVFGKDPVADPVGVLGDIGYLSEDRDLPNWMRVGELMSYTQAFFPRWDERFAEELCDQFELDKRARVRDLSRGQRARAGLLVAVAHRPQLLVLDEPSSGLDPVVRRDILGAIIRTIADEGRTVLFSSHLLDEVERVADHIAMIHKGRIVLAGALDAIKQEHMRVTVRLGAGSSAPPQIPGEIARVGNGAEWTYVCGGNREQWQQSVASAEVEIVEESGLSLDEIFVARVRGAA